MPHVEVKPEHLCPFCAGSGFEFSDEAEAVACLLCGGTGLATVAGDLGATHSDKRRPFTYQPGTRKLTLGNGSIGQKKAAVYLVTEFIPDREFDGRAFRLLKLDWTGHYACLVGSETASCDCAGKTFLNTDKANLRSWLRDEPEVKSAGCRHLDALKVLLAGGWLDLPEHAQTEGVK